MSDWPKYESHKIVRAKPIVDIGTYEFDNGVDTPGTPCLCVQGDGDGDLDVFRPTEPAMARRATIGDYAIVYQDGYKSVSPKAAFEDGYTKVEDPS